MARIIWTTPALEGAEEIRDYIPPASGRQYEQQAQDQRALS